MAKVSDPTSDLQHPVTTLRKHFAGGLLDPKADHSNVMLPPCSNESSRIDRVQPNGKIGRPIERQR